MLQTNFADDNQTKGNTDGGESGGDDGGFTFGIEAFFVLLAGEQYTDGTVSQPGSNTVQSTAAGQIKDRPHQLDHQRA